MIFIYSYSYIPIPVTSANTTANKDFYTQRTDRKVKMCAKFEYRNLSRYYSTNSATPPYISTNGTVNTRLLIDKTKSNQYLTINLQKLVL